MSNDEAGGGSRLWRERAGTGPLSGVRVVDFGQFIAGPMLAMLLADQGADVIRIDPPGGPRMTSRANAALLRGRRSIALDLKSAVDRQRAIKLIADADVVIENFRPGVMRRLGLGSEEVASFAPQAIYCSMPGFGSDDARAGLPGWEGVVMAAGGGYSLSGLRISGGAPADAPPAFSAVPLASVFAAIEMAMAVAASLIARDEDGLGERIEIALFDALFEASGVQSMTLERSPLRQTPLGSGVYRCADGRHLTFIAQWFRHLVWFVQTAGMEEWIESGFIDFAHLRDDPAAPDELQRRLVDLFATRDALEWERLGRAHGCSLAMIRSTEEFRAEPMSTQSGALVRVDDPALGETIVPGAAVALAGAAPFVQTRARGETDAASLIAALDALPDPARREAADAVERRAPLDGIRVLDLSRVVAAPTTAKLLGQLGADVTKLDVDPEGGTASFEEPLFHVHLNRGKRTVIADLFTPEGRATLTEILGSTDVVVQNFTLGTAERLGTSDDQLRAHSAEIINVYLNAFGSTGDWAAFRGYAELANVSSGLTRFVLGDDAFRTGSSPSIDLPRWIFTDYAAGVLGAFGALLAVRERRRTGHAHRVETSLLHVTAIEQILWICGDPDDAIVRSSGRTATGWGPLQRMYRCADGWLFLGALPEQADAVLAAIGVQAEAASSGPGLERVLEAALARTAAADACAMLCRGGAGAQPITTLAELMVPGGIADERGLRLSDTSPRHGTVVMPGPVIRFARTPMRAGELPAKFGTDVAPAGAQRRSINSVTTPSSNPS